MIRIFLSFIILILTVGCEDIFEKDISEKQVVVLAPEPEFVTDYSRLTFLWEELEGVEHYHLIVVSPSFSKLKTCCLDTIITGYTFNVEFDSGKYEWQIRGINSAYKSLPVNGKFTVQPDTIKAKLGGEP